MNSQSDDRRLVSVESDLFGVLFAFHKKIVTLLRESSLSEDKLKGVSDRIETLLEEATADMKATQQVNVADRFDAAYDEAKRLIEELTHSEDVKKTKPKTRRLKSRDKKP